MKKELCCALFFISVVSFAIGQRPLKKNFLLPGSNRDQITRPIPLNIAGMNNPPVHCPPQKSFHPRPIKWNWDTIFTFDTLGSGQRFTQTFNHQGNVLFLIAEQWQANEWVNVSKDSYTYDSNGNILVDLNEEWQFSTWVNNERYTYSYDSNGNMLALLDEDWQANAWSNSWKYTYTYDANGNTLTSLFELWQANAWEKYGRSTYSYDATGNMLVSLSESWQSNAWVNVWKYTYTYDAAGNMLTNLYEEWLNNAWVNYGRRTNTYDATGNMLTSLIEIWQAGAWMNFGRYTYTCDAAGNMLTSMVELWQTNAWLYNSKNTYTYDESGNSVAGKYEEWQSGDWKPGLGILDLYSQQLSVFYVYFIYRYEASYISFNTGMANTDPGNKSLSVFPNPAIEKITIDLPGLTSNKSSSLIIYEMNGRELIRQPVIGSKSEIDVGLLPRGLYLVRLSNDHETIIGKFLKN